MRVIAGRIVASIVRPVLATGGKSTDMLVLLESVVVGVLLALVRLGGEERVLDELMTHVKARMAEARLGDLDPAGKA